jgi:hypothetical protein
MKKGNATDTPSALVTSLLEARDIDHIEMA